MSDSENSLGGFNTAIALLEKQGYRKTGNPYAVGAYIEYVGGRRGLLFSETIHYQEGGLFAKKIGKGGGFHFIAIISIGSTSSSDFTDGNLRIVSAFASRDDLEHYWSTHEAMPGALSAAMPLNDFLARPNDMGIIVPSICAKESAPERGMLRSLVRLLTYPLSHFHP